EGEDILDGHQDQVGDGSAGHLDVLRILTQARALAVRAIRPAAIPRKHDAVLYLVRLRLEVREEIPDAFEVSISCPENLAFVFCQLVVRAVDGEIEFDPVLEKGFQPFTHYFGSPRCDG